MSWEDRPMRSHLSTRRRAISTTRLKLSNGQPTSNYNVKSMCRAKTFQDQATARKVLRFERRRNGVRRRTVFDLMRWGIADQVNDFFAHEKLRTIYQSALFKKGRDEFLPVPQNQIFWVKVYMRKIRVINSGN